MIPHACAVPAALSGAESSRPSRHWLDRLPVVLLSLAASGLAGQVGLVLSLQVRITRLETSLEGLQRQMDRIERKLDAQAEASRGR